MAELNAAAWNRLDPVEAELAALRERVQAALNIIADNGCDCDDDGADPRKPGQHDCLAGRIQAALLPPPAATSAAARELEALRERLARAERRETYSEIQRMLQRERLARAEAKRDEMAGLLRAWLQECGDAGDDLTDATAKCLGQTPSAESLRERLERAEDLLQWAHDTLREINPSNYDHDDVCALNSASVEVILAIQAHQKPTTPAESLAAEAAGLTLRDAAPKDLPEVDSKAEWRARQAEQEGDHAL